MSSRHRPKDPEITAAQARVLHLEAQGLCRPPPRRARPDDLLAAIERMRLLQIDSIHVIARSPYLVLFSRLGAYPVTWLDQALEDGYIAEAWAHEACFVPAADYLWHDAWRGERGNHWAYRRALRLRDEQPQAMQTLLDRVRRHGPVRAAELAGERKRRPGWWSWTEEKSGLEAWFALGELMVVRRQAFQRVYDLSERVMPRLRATSDAMDAVPEVEDVRQRWVLDAVRALGVAKAEWVGDYHRQGRVAADLLDELVACGQLARVRVRGWEQPAFVHVDHLTCLQRVAAGQMRATRSTLLSPFDPVVWDRGRARTMFGFDYTLECYTPAPRRRYGYFTLPFLCRGRLAGRVDAKAHRREGVFELRAVYLEPGEKPTPALVAALAGALRELAAWHDASRIEIGHCEPRALRRLLAVDI